MPSLEALQYFPMFSAELFLHILIKALNNRVSIFKCSVLFYKSFPIPVRQILQNYSLEILDYSEPPTLHIPFGANSLGWKGSL